MNATDDGGATWRVLSWERRHGRIAPPHDDVTVVVACRIRKGEMIEQTFYCAQVCSREGGGGSQVGKRKRPSSLVTLEVDGRPG